MGPAGHLAVGLAAKRFAPKAPLWLLLSASVLPDILGIGFRMLGIEYYDHFAFDANLGDYVYILLKKDWSHGLLMTFVWSALAAAVVYLIWRDWRTSGVTGLAVLSHWVFDFIVHPPELPLLFAGSPKVGLGLWSMHNGFWISIILEIALFAIGMLLYLDSRKARRKAEDPAP